MEVQLKAERIRAEREARAWTQEHLAEVAGLGVRTVQRIEATGTASFESAAALSAVLDIPLKELQITTVKQGEFRQDVHSLGQDIHSLGSKLLVLLADPILKPIIRGSLMAVLLFLVLTVTLPLMLRLLIPPIEPGRPVSISPSLAWLMSLIFLAHLAIPPLIGAWIAARNSVRHRLVIALAATIVSATGVMVMAIYQPRLRMIVWDLIENPRLSAALLVCACGVISIVMLRRYRRRAT